MNKCICGAELEAQPKQSTQNLIIEALIGYWRWVAEGKPENQVYYNPYYKNIEFLGENLYSFRIQTYDSPEGDAWIRGKIKISSISNNNIAIIEKTREEV